LQKLLFLDREADPNIKANLTMSSSKTSAQGNSAQLIANITQWNAENEQKNSDLAAAKAKATEEFLNQPV
jgi:hypothetical protein